MDESRKRKRLELEYRMCPHCKKVLKTKEFQAHKRLFYDATTEIWARDVTGNVHGVGSGQRHLFLTLTAYSASKPCIPCYPYP